MINNKQLNIYFYVVSQCCFPYFLLISKVVEKNIDKENNYD